MSKAPLLEIEPQELQFIFELKKQSSCSVQLANNTYDYVAFKVKTTSPKKYSVRPNVGVLMPKSTCEFIVTMQAPREAPADMVCKDKFLIQSTTVPAETTSEDISSSLFVKDGSRYVEENKLKVVLISPPDSPELSPINGEFKNGHDHEEVQIYSKQKIQPPEPMMSYSVPGICQVTQVLKNPEHIVVNAALNLEEDMNLKPEKDRQLNTMNDVEEEKEVAGLKVLKDEELNTVKEVEELKPKKEVELKDLDLNTVNNIEEVKPEKGAVLNVSKDLDLKTAENPEELKPDKEAELKLSKDLDFKIVKNVEVLKPQKEAELKVSKGIEERKLMEAIEEMKLKLDGLESKLNESGATISRLTDERRLSIQETKMLQEKLVSLRNTVLVIFLWPLLIVLAVILKMADLINKDPRKVQVGFPLLYVCMVALVGVFLGYHLRS